MVKSKDNKKLKLHAVVVIFHPTLIVVNNIISYLDSVDILYIIDNSEVKNDKIIDKISGFSDKCIYIDNHGNKGIAQALNDGARLASENGAEWLLTMDQDSYFNKGELDKLIEYVTECNSDEIGLVSPLQLTALKISPNIDVEIIRTVMTSGNIVNLSAYDYVKGYNNDFFIDAVDWEFCLKLNINGFKVIRLNYATLIHNLGNPSTHKAIFTGLEIDILNHNCIRRYYITRNKLQLIKNYFRYFPKTCIGYFLSIITDFKNVLLYEKEKKEKIKYMLKGMSDSFHNQMGPIDK